jgi:hypothetical protein
MTAALESMSARGDDQEQFAALPLLEPIQDLHGGSCFPQNRLSMLGVLPHVVLVTSVFIAVNAALLLLSSSSLPAFLICYSAAPPHGCFSACLCFCVLINS